MRGLLPALPTMLFLATAVLGGSLEVDAAGGGGGGESSQPEGTVVFIKLDPFQVPVVQDGKLKGRIVVVLNLETKVGPERNRAEHYLPRMRAEFLTFLRRYGSLDRGARININLIKARLQRIADDVVGPDTVVVLIREATRVR